MGPIAEDLPLHIPSQWSVNAFRGPTAVPLKIHLPLRAKLPAAPCRSPPSDGMLAPSREPERDTIVSI